MNNIARDLTAALDRRAADVVVEDGLDAILNDTALVRPTAPRAPQRRSGLLAVAAATLIAVGGAGLMWATRAREATSPASAPDTPANSLPAAETVDPRNPNEPESVHLWMGDGWELTFADPNGYSSTWSSTTRTSDDPDAEPSVPSVQFSNLDGRSSTLLDDLEPESEVTIAGTDTTLYSNQAGTLRIAIVPLNDDHTVQVVIENAPTDDVSAILSAISAMTETEWVVALDAHSSPNTTVIVQLDDN